MTGKLLRTTDFVVRWSSLLTKPHFLKGDAVRQLWALFFSVLALRLAFPFIDSPLDHLGSDALRHWQNGLDFDHPNVMGGIHPFLYQLWLHLLQTASMQEPFVILFVTGMLCALMPVGWFLALIELLEIRTALLGAILMGLIPAFLDIYAFFMNETLLLTLTGFAFGATFRALRTSTLSAFVAACGLWFAASFTRTIVIPMALACVLSVWWKTPHKFTKAIVASAMLVAFLLPAGLHARSALGYFAPFGDLYTNKIYRNSGDALIMLDFGSKGNYLFGSPSFFNPAFYPISNWTTDRAGTVIVAIDTRKGRADWIQAVERVGHERVFSIEKDYWENFLYLWFAQSWPDNNVSTIGGFLTVWTRWIWPPIIVFVAWGAFRSRFNSSEWLLAGCGLAVFVFLAVQNFGIVDGRYRKPIDPLFVAAAVTLLGQRRFDRAKLAT